MATDTTVNNLVINKLTKAQYDAIQSPSNTELYLVPDVIDSAPTSGSTNCVESGGVYSALQDKLDAPSTAGTNGQVLTSDGQGGQSWQTPTSAVSDVTVGGTSVVTNGVAVVPSIPDVSGKADKVTGATNGNFAGLDSNGNLTDSGKKASDFATPIPVVNVSTVPASMDADKFYDYGTLSADIIFPSLNTPSDATKAHVFWWTFKVPATAPNVGWPASGITEWSGGSPPDINASTTYEIMVNNGFASYIMST